MYGERDVILRPTLGLSRRAFMRSAAAGATALSLPAWAVPRPGDESESGRRESPLRVGLIGCGGRGGGAAAQAIQADPGVLLTAMGDLFPDRLSGTHRALAEHFGDRVDVPEHRRFTGFDSYQQVIDSGVDVVLLCAPSHFRPAHLEAAVRAEKHVFCEKPMAVDAPGVRSVIASAEAAKGRGLSIVSGFCWRYSSPERAAFRRIHDGAIGKVTAVHTAYHAAPIDPPRRDPEWTEMEWQLRNWWHYNWLSGDHIVEQACHSVDKINWAMNGRAPSRITALGGRQSRPEQNFGNVFDHFSVIYEYDDGTRCFHTCRQVANTPFDNTDFIIGTKGTCFINGWAPTHELRDTGGAVRWSYDGPRPNMYQVEHDELFASIRAGTPINDGHDMAQSTMMSLAGRMAAYTGQTLTWEQVMNSREDLTPPAYEFGDLPVAPVPIPGRTRFT